MNAIRVEARKLYAVSALLFLAVILVLVWLFPDAAALWSGQATPTPVFASPAQEEQNARVAGAKIERPVVSVPAWAKANSDSPVWTSPNWLGDPDDVVWVGFGVLCPPNAPEGIPAWQEGALCLKPAQELTVQDFQSAAAAAMLTAQLAAELREPWVEITGTAWPSTLPRMYLVLVDDPLAAGMDSPSFSPAIVVDYATIKQAMDSLAVPTRNRNGGAMHPTVDNAACFRHDFAREIARAAIHADGTWLPAPAEIGAAEYMASMIAPCPRRPDLDAIYDAPRALFWGWHGDARDAAVGVWSNALLWEQWYRHGQSAEMWRLLARKTGEAATISDEVAGLYGRGVFWVLNSGEVPWDALYPKYNQEPWQGGQVFALRSTDTYKGRTVETPDLLTARKAASPLVTFLPQPYPTRREATFGLAGESAVSGSKGYIIVVWTGQRVGQTLTVQVTHHPPSNSDSPVQLTQTSMSLNPGKCDEGVAWTLPIWEWNGAGSYTVTITEESPAALQHASYVGVSYLPMNSASDLSEHRLAMSDFLLAYEDRFVKSAYLVSTNGSTLLVNPPSFFFLKWQDGTLTIAPTADTDHPIGQFPETASAALPDKGLGVFFLSPFYAQDTPAYLTLRP